MSSSRLSLPLRLFLLVALVASLPACTAKLDGRSIGFGSSPPPGPRPIAAATAGAGASGTAATADNNAASDAPRADAGNSANPVATNAPPSSTSFTSASAAAAAAPPSASPSSASSSTCRPQRWADPWPYLDRPADPWLAVANGRPVRVAIPTDLQGMIGPPSAPCDAAHDHCLRDCTWLVAEPTGNPNDILAYAFHVDANGVFVERDYSNQTAEPGFIAYRSVPVTRKNLRVGARVLSVTPRRWDGDLPVVTMLERPTNTVWVVSTVTSIDWAAGVVMLEGRPRPYLLSATRLAVLRYEDGGKVELIPGTDARAPATADVLALPPP